DTDDIRSLAGDPIVVHYAPQGEVLARARLALTHGGLNTVLDALACGVPLIAVPLTYEQPAIAARLRWTGAGLSISSGKLKAGLLRETIRSVLEGEAYTRNARRLAASIAAAGGVVRAGDIIESLL
ncbi:MAG TPA: nucleotide disphospho-sugar-binding domain-containing protein, partial [Bryobacteraceae bacterium]|nr:nucleotide disphospho-sugar-binding domain-containing protein [Bryobacteraceae bacterium]